MGPTAVRAVSLDVCTGSSIDTLRFLGALAVLCGVVASASCTLEGGWVMAMGARPGQMAEGLAIVTLAGIGDVFHDRADRPSYRDGTVHEVVSHTFT